MSDAQEPKDPGTAPGGEARGTPELLAQAGRWQPRPAPPRAAFLARLGEAQATRRRRWRWGLGGTALAGVAIAATFAARTAPPAPPASPVEPAPAATAGVEQAPAPELNALPGPGVPAAAPATAPATTLCLPDADATPTLCTATYLGDASDDEAVGVVLQPGGAVVVAGHFPGALPDEQPATGGRARGALVRLGDHGRRVVAATRLARTLRDVDVDRGSGDVLVATDVGVARVAADLSMLVFHTGIPGGGAARVAVGEAGTIAALDRRGAVHVFSARGERLETFAPGAGTARDLAVDDRNGAILVAGFIVHEGGSACTKPVPVPFLRSFDHDGALRWRAWDRSVDEVLRHGSRRCAHSRATLVTVGADGKLYLAGDSYGGDTPFALDPRDPGRLAPNVGFDPWSSPVASDSKAGIGYVARLTPDSGALEVGQFLLTRGPSGAGAPLSITALSADGDGSVLVAGRADCCLPDRATLRFAGQALGAPRPEGWMAILPPDLRGRTLWTTWTGAGVASATGAFLADGTAAVVASQPARTSPLGVLTKDALSPERPGGADAWLGVWRMQSSKWEAPPTTR
jgi:hypothetical protein